MASISRCHPPPLEILEVVEVVEVIEVCSVVMVLGCCKNSSVFCASFQVSILPKQRGYVVLYLPPPPLPPLTTHTTTVDTRNHLVSQTRLD